MPPTILLIEPNHDARGRLAEELRIRGFHVIPTDSVEGARAHLPQQNIATVLVADTLLAIPDTEAQLADDPILARTSRWVLVDHPPSAHDPGCLPRHDPMAIAERLLASLPHASPASPDRGGDFRGALQQVSIPDVLQLLAMNRRTGTLTVVTPDGQGEVRLIDGEIADAVFRRVEGTKALFRLFSENVGSFSFVSGTPTPLCRVAEPTRILLLEGMRHTDEVRRIREDLHATQDALQATRPPLADAPELDRQILSILQVPRTADELLDELPCDDLDILISVQSLTTSGLVRRIPRGALSVELAEPDKLSLLSAIIRQLKRPGYQGNSRIIFFSSPPRLSASLHALGRIADSLPATDATRAAPVAHRLATLRLADAQELDVLGLPNSLSYAPLWNLTLPGSAAIVSLDNERCKLLEEAANLAGVVLLDAETLVGSLDEGDPCQIAALVRATLESAAGR
jgi:hypothetical protein